jgi:hypothetical protein
MTPTHSFSSQKNDIIVVPPVKMHNWGWTIEVGKNVLKTV